MDASGADSGTVVAREQRIDREHTNDIASDVRRLVPSSEPAVVFASLAQLCVPSFSDACTVDIAEDHHTSYRISYPPPGADEIAASVPPDGTRTVRTRFESVEVTDARKYTGVITHTWRTHEPTATETAQAAVLARHAVTLIYYERTCPDKPYTHDTVVQLRNAVLTNRDIGVAMGILMTTRHISLDAAFTVLSAASQNTNRKVSEIALEVIDTGTVDVHPRKRMPAAPRVGTEGPPPIRRQR